MTNRHLFAAAVVAALAAPAQADEVLDAIEAARKAYEAGDYGEARQSLDSASQLIGEKNAEAFAVLLPEPLTGWTAEKADVSAVGTPMLSASTATRRYTNTKGNQISVQITGDSTLLAPMAAMLANSQFAGFIGKITRVGGQRAIINHGGDVYVVVGTKFLVTVTGSGPAADKLAYAQAVDAAKLSKM